MRQIENIGRVTNPPVTPLAWLIKSYGLLTKYFLNTVVVRITTHNKKRMATAKKKKEKHPKGFAQIPGTD